MTDERRHGFAKVPIRCPHCTRKLPPSAVVMHGAALRCDGCQRLFYVLPVMHVRLVYLIDIAPQEAVELAAKGASPFEVLEALGVTLRVA